MSEVGAVCLNSAGSVLEASKAEVRCWQDYIPLGVLRMNAFVLIQVVGQIQLFGVVGRTEVAVCLLAVVHRSFISLISTVSIVTCVRL